MRQMLEAERYMQAEYYRANAPQHFRVRIFPSMDIFNLILF